MSMSHDTTFELGRHASAVAIALTVLAAPTGAQGIPGLVDFTASPAELVAATDKARQATQSAIEACQGYRDIARGIFMLKEAGQPRPTPRNAVDAAIIDDIYTGKSGAITADLAAGLGPHYCVPVLYEKFLSGQLRYVNAAQK
jgi:hypothetical protein